MEGVLVLGLFFLWMVLWMMMLRHERRRAVAGKARHGAFRLLIAAAALLVMLFLGGCAVLLLSAHPAALQSMNWSVLGFYFGLPFIAAAIAFWLTMRRGTPG